MYLIDLKKKTTDFSNEIIDNFFSFPQRKKRQDISLACGMESLDKYEGKINKKKLLIYNGILCLKYYIFRL